MTTCCALFICLFAVCVCISVGHKPHCLSGEIRCCLEHFLNFPLFQTRRPRGEMREHFTKPFIEMLIAFGQGGEETVRGPAGRPVGAYTRFSAGFSKSVAMHFCFWKHNGGKTRGNFLVSAVDGRDDFGSYRISRQALSHSCIMQKARTVKIDEIFKTDSV